MRGVHRGVLCRQIDSALAIGRHDAPAMKVEAPTPNVILPSKAQTN
jgi:hypothetical protein